MFENLKSNQLFLRMTAVVMVPAALLLLAAWVLSPSAAGSVMAYLAILLIGVWCVLFLVGAIGRLIGLKN